MLASMRKITLAAVTGAASLMVPGQQADAGPFDWLFGRPVLAYPAPYVAGYGGVPTAAPVNAPSVVPMPVGVLPGARTPYDASPYPISAPYATARPVMVAQPIVATPSAAMVVQPVQPVIVRYAPNYRTTVNQVPVTYYRPVTTYNVAGYPAVVGQPCNTYTWQAQRVPTIVRRPWFPFGSRATYGYAPTPNAVMYSPAAGNYYAPAPNAVTYAPAAGNYYAPAPNAVMYAPACANCPVVNAAPIAAPYSATAVPTYGAQPAGATFGIPSQQPTSGYLSPAADQAPTLMQGNFPVSPGVDTSAPPTSAAVGGVVPGTPIPADSASTRRETNSPYRVTPIPAPDVRTFDASPGGSPKAPPLLNGRERTVLNKSTGQSIGVEHASWTTGRPSASQSAAPVRQPAVRQPATKPLWNDTGWRNAK